MDVSHLGYSGLHLLKKNDPFMYYRIPGAKDISEEDLNQMLPSLVIGSIKDSGEEDVASRRQNRRRSVSNSHLLVRRQSRISYKGYPDMNLDNVRQEIAEMKSHVAKRRRSSYETEVSECQADNYDHRCGYILQNTLLEMFNDSFQEEDDEVDDSKEKKSSIWVVFALLMKCIALIVTIS